jgi:hypothetical protein
MPNIIEQQDLLKGLPDARLMTLLQKPMGDIPPFLVAAEAQRRQQIRQQFAGSGSKESVVDTLTKQLANVPQNVNSPARTPPTIPQTPQMQGVMALQQQQAMTDIAQQAQPQTMRSGGIVQRYNNGSLVGSSPQRLKWVMENFDLPNEQAAQKFIMAHPEAGLGSELNFPADMSLVDRLAQSIAPVQKLNNEVDSITTNPYTQAYASGYRGIGVMPGAKTEKEVMDNRAEQSRLKKQYQQYAASQPKPEPGETPDEYRARLEKILAAQEPSDMEKAQGYFAMAEQFLDPSKTTMQSLVGAGQAFAQSAAERDRAQREAKLALERGLLEYDIGKAEDIRQKKEREQEKAAASLKARTDIATRRLDDLQRSQQNVSRRIDDIQTEVMKNAIDPEIAKAEILKLQSLYDSIGAEMADYNSFLKSNYGFGPVEEFDPNKSSLYKPGT